MAEIPKVVIDTSEAEEKLERVILMLERIHQLISKSWLLKIVFYGFSKHANA